MVIITKVRIEVLGRSVSRRLSECQGSPGSAVGSRLELGDPLLGGADTDQLLVQQAYLARVINCQRRVQGVVDSLQFSRPRAAAICGSQHVQRVDAVRLVVVVGNVND